MTVAISHPLIWRDLAELGTDLKRDLAFHQLPGDQHDRFAHKVLQAAIAHLRDDTATDVML